MRRLRPGHRAAFALRASRERARPLAGSLADQPSFVAHEVVAVAGGFRCPCGWHGTEPLGHIFGTAT